MRYGVIGGFAAVLDGSALSTADVDVLPARDMDNLDRLGEALEALGARRRTADGPVEAPMDGTFLRAMPFMVNLTTKHGDLDVTFEPAGPLRGFDDWDADASDVEIAEGLTIRASGTGPQWWSARSSTTTARH